jgi:hypothetical protein
MAAQPWKLYNRAIRKLGAGVIALPGAVRIALVTSASNFATATLSLLSQVTNQVAAGNGYVTGGQGLAGEVWTAGASAGQIKFDADDPIWTATGGTIPNIKAAVLYMSGTNHVLGYASLTSSQFTLAMGNTLTLQMHSSGIFTAANG